MLYYWNNDKNTHCFFAEDVSNGCRVQGDLSFLLDIGLHSLHPSHHFIQTVLDTHRASESDLQFLIAITYRLGHVVITLHYVVCKHTEANQVIRQTDQVLTVWDTL